MTDVEQRLAELLQRTAPDTDGIAFADVAALRQRRRVILWSSLGAALVIVAVAVTSALAWPFDQRNVAPTVGHQPGATIPWIDTPARGPVTRTAPTTPLPVDARACTASEVTARFAPGGGPLGVNGGFLATFVSFRNVSPTECVLNGYPQVTATQPGHPDVTGHDGSIYQQPSDVSANMTPGASTLLTLQTHRYCAARPSGGGAPVLYRHIAVTLPGGGTVNLTSDSKHALDLRCGLHLSRFFVRQPNPPDPPDPLSGLQVNLRLPRTVRAGAVLHYVAELTNTTNQPISLRPCPSYLELAKTAAQVTDKTPAQVKKQYLLNCARLPSIPARRSVSFSMQLGIPAGTQPGRAHIEWSLIDVFSRQADASIDVT